MFRWLTAGESHGRALVAICEGVPAGVRVSTADIAAALARRRAGYGRGARMKFEQDEVELTGGIRHGVHARRARRDPGRQHRVAQVGDGDVAGPGDPADLESLARNAPLTRPRPGHADLAGMQKYGHDDARPVLERASARETAARVALGEVARQLLSQALGIEILSHVVALGPVAAPDGLLPEPADRGGADRRGPGALRRPDDQRGDGRGDRRGPQGRRYPRRGRRGGGLRPAARARQLHVTGTGGSTRGWPPRS